MGVYKYPNSNLKPENLAELEKSIFFSFVTQNKEASKKLEEAAILQESIRLCRLLQDGPPNVVTPTYVAEHAVKQAKSFGLQIEVWDKKMLMEKGFHAMLAVANGSAQEPRLVIIEYKPENYSKTIAFVGKGLTMDTGGYSLKSPSTHQEGMKYDMSGSAVVLSAICAIAQLKLPVHVYAVAALCENMVDAHAYRVNDVITGYSGKTIEILNTDAEGRVVLSDALSYTARHLKPDCLVEYSTLTGAMIVSLGHVAAGLCAFDAKIEETVLKAASQCGERLYPLPAIWEEYAEDIKGTISDVCNVNTTRGAAGSLTAAAFLKEFVDDVPFAHIDIAGVADGNQGMGFPRKGGSGYGVQLSVEIAKQFAK